MTTPRPMPDLSALRARLGALPLDRAPLRRAGLLAVLLVVLLVAGRSFGPGRSAATAPVSRQEVRAETENGSATRQAAPSGWTAGRMLALLLLAGGAGGALLLHRRSAPAAGPPAALDVIETHTLGPGQTLQLVACGDDVLLLSATQHTVRLLRHWPRDRFDRSAVSFADVLASADAPASDSGEAATGPDSADEPGPSAIEAGPARLDSPAERDPAETGPIPAGPPPVDPPPAGPPPVDPPPVDPILVEPAPDLAPPFVPLASSALPAAPRERSVSPRPRLGGLVGERAHDRAPSADATAPLASPVPAPLAEALAEPARQPLAAAERPALGTPPAAPAPVLRQFQPADA